MKLRLKVEQIKEEEIYRDFARIPELHRGGIAEGSLCRIAFCQNSVSLVVRGLQNVQTATLRIDSLTRDKLKVIDGLEYDFEIEQLNWLSQLLVPWNASDPFNRQAMRLSIIALFLGVVGLILGLISIFKG